MEIKAIIFDLDGVIVFSDEFHYLAWKHLADELDIPFDREKNNRLRGVSRMASLEIILEDYKGAPFTSEEKEEFASRKNGYYREYLGQMKPEDVSEDARFTLGKLKEEGYKIAIGSSSKNTKYILEKVDLLDEFDAISDGTNITKSKPDPEVFLKAAEFLGIEPRYCMVVEDAFSGIDAAKAAGMYAAGIGDAASYEKTDFAINRLSDLVGILEAEKYIRRSL